MPSEEREQDVHLSNKQGTKKKEQTTSARNPLGAISPAERGACITIIYEHIVSFATEATLQNKLISFLIASDALCIICKYLLPLRCHLHKQCRSFCYN